MTYDWVYLCSDPRRLKLTFKFLPPRLPNLGTIYVGYLSHLDPEGRRQELEDAVDACWHADVRDIQVVDLSELEELLPDGLHRYWETDKKRWSLAVKLLLPLYFKTPLLYTDDDVLLVNDPTPLMDRSFGSKGCFRFGDKKPQVKAELAQIFLPGSDIDRRLPEWYDSRALDAGVWFARTLDADDWRDRLERLAAAEYVKTLTTRNLELRCLDQRFLTGWGWRWGWRQQTIRNGFAPPQQIRPSFFRNTTFIHYKSQSKQRWMELLEQYGRTE